MSGGVRPPVPNLENKKKTLLSFPGGSEKMKEKPNKKRQQPKQTGDALRREFSLSFCLSFSTSTPLSPSSFFSLSLSFYNIDAGN